jgi:hypothetical protein
MTSCNHAAETAMEDCTMADDLTKRGPPDGMRINTHEDWEVRDWSKHFGCTEAQLKEAARMAGPMTKDVLAYLKRHGQTSR